MQVHTARLVHTSDLDDETRQHAQEIHVGIGFFEKLLCFGDVVVKVFAHTDRLCTLSGKYVCVLHIFAEFLLARAKIRIYFLTLHRNGSQRAGQGPV